MGCTLPLDRRLELLAWAVKTDLYIVEDDYDSDFRYVGSPLAALKALDSANRVFYVGTFSKCLGAGFVSAMSSCRRS
jgi:GntR family transcriptional regulator/MocR family aminotransferase